jgi:hypothetical protein
MTHVLFNTYFRKGSGRERIVSTRQIFRYTIVTTTTTTIVTTTTTTTVTITTTTITTVTTANVLKIFIIFPPLLWRIVSNNIIIMLFSSVSTLSRSRSLLLRCYNQTNVLGTTASTIVVPRRTMASGHHPKPEWTGIDKVVRSYFPEDWQRT